MVEAENEETVHRLAEAIAGAIQKELGEDAASR